MGDSTSSDPSTYDELGLFHENAAEFGQVQELLARFNGAPATTSPVSVEEDIPVYEQFLGAARDGFGFCNVVFGWDAGDVCYDDASYTGWHSGYPDALARVDPFPRIRGPAAAAPAGSARAPGRPGRPRRSARTGAATRLRAARR